MHTEPLTAARYPDSTDGTNLAQYYQNLAYDLAVNTCPRFATAAARDSAYAAYTAAGGVLANGRSCWTDDAGYWDRIGGVWTARPNRTDVFGTSGTLSLVGGWAVLSGYHTPTWYLSSDGWVTLSGGVSRTAASFALGTDTPFQFANLPGAITPVVSASPLCTVGLGVGSTSSYPARLFVTNSSAFVSVMGMGSGSGTMSQNLGFIIFDGIRWHL